MQRALRWLGSAYIWWSAQRMHSTTSRLRTL